MKTLFIPVKSKDSLDFSQLAKLNLPKNLAIAYSIQFQESALALKDYLSKNYNILAFMQVLGCSKPTLPSSVEAIILVSTGRFHAISLAYETSLPVYLLENNSFVKINEKEVETLAKKRKGAYINYLNSKELGIIVSTKPGQENLAKALSLKKKLKDKQSYLFITNNIDPLEFENFGLNCWINTACPRMDFNLPILNIADLNSC